MMRTRKLAEAEELLEMVGSWPEEELEELPLFYRRKARQYRRIGKRLGLPVNEQED